MEMENTPDKTVMGQMEKSTQADLDAYQEQLENCEKAAEAQKDLAKMIEIARRIAHGDKVPAKDEKKLMEFNFQLYQTAKEAAVICENTDPIQYESLFDDEEDVTEEKMNELEDENTEDSIEKEDTSGEYME